MKRATSKRSSQGDILYGVHPIIECLKAGKRKIISIYMTKPEPKGWQRIKPHLPKRKPNVQYITREALTRMAGSGDHMGIVAFVSTYSYATKEFTPQNKPRVLLLDGVQDVGNMGAILRSAYCTNIDAVIVSKKGCARMTPGVFKASAGLAEHLPIYQVPSLGHAIGQLKAVGYTLYMAVAEGGTCATKMSFSSPMGIVIGSEEKGIDQKVRDKGELVTLPQRDTSSYNASVAAGIFLFLTGFSK